LEEAFTKFSDIPDPNTSNQRVMNKEQLRSLISVLTDSDTKDDDPQLNSIFLSHSKDGVIEMDDYLTFWRNSVSNDENLVW
jgi:hypothetical protein